MADDSVLIERDGPVLVLTINRPKVLNALNAQTLDALSHAIDAARDDAGVRTIVITGSGDRSFVAGADINELASQTPVDGREHARRGQALFDRIERLGKPVIAAINGFALGGGCELAMACTIRLAAENAKLGQPEINLGLMPGRSACRAWSDAGARSSCCSRAIRSRPTKPGGSDSSTKSCPRRI